MKENLVFTNGCFDVLHVGHVRMLKWAASIGRLVVGLNSDDSVVSLKGRPPLNPADERREMLLSYWFVSDVVVFDEVTPWSLIQKLKPDVIVKGPEYRGLDVVGSDVAVVRFPPWDKEHSSQDVISRALARASNASFAAVDSIVAGVVTLHRAKNGKWLVSDAGQRSIDSEGKWADRLDALRNGIDIKYAEFESPFAALEHLLKVTGSNA